jgi:hypothetical protein
MNPKEYPKLLGKELTSDVKSGERVKTNHFKKKNLHNKH